MPENYEEDDLELTQTTTDYLKENEKQYDQMLEERLTKKIAKGAGITFFGSVIGKGLSYITYIIIARLLGAKAFGLYVLGFAIFGLAELLSRMGLHNGALRYVSMYMGEGARQKVKGTIIQSIVFSFGVGIGIGLILFVSSNFIATGIFHKPELTRVIEIFSIGVPFMASMMVAAFGTRGFQAMQYFVYLRHFFQPTANLFLIGLLYWLGFRLYGAVSAWVISAGFGFFLAIYFIRREFPDISNVDSVFNTKELINFSVPLITVGFLQLFILWTDTFMLGHFRSAIDVGIYRAAAQTALLLTFALGAFNSIFSPIISDLYNKGEIGTLAEIFSIVSKWVFYLSFLLYLVIISTPKQILKVFSPEFVLGWSPLLILAFANLVNSSMGIFGSVLVMSGKQKLEFYNSLGISMLNIILNVLFIPKFGMIGAALATSISIINLNVIRALEVRLILNLWPYNKRYLKGLAAGIVAMGVNMLIMRLIPSFHYLSLLSISMTSLTAVFFTLLAVFKLDDEDKLILKAIWLKILRRMETR